MASTKTRATLAVISVLPISQAAASTPTPITVGSPMTSYGPSPVPINLQVIDDGPQSEVLLNGIPLAASNSAIRPIRSTRQGRTDSASTGLSTQHRNSCARGTSISSIQRRKPSPG